MSPQAEYERDSRGTMAHSLKERIKELNCLYGISQLIDRHGDDTDGLLQGITDLLPVSWQYPGIAHGRITIGEQVFTTDEFAPSRWRQAAEILLDDEVIGCVEVFYMTEMPESAEGPFLNEERQLIEAIAERLGKALKRIRTGEQLAMERLALRNMNIALKEVLNRVEEEKREMGARIQANVDKIIMPTVHALQQRVGPGNINYLELLRQNLTEIVAPFTREFSRRHTLLTPTEIRICTMIRGGQASKSIANLLNIAPATVNRHRENIRRKLGLTNRSINLRSYLDAQAEEMLF